MNKPSNILFIHYLQMIHIYIHPDIVSISGEVYAKVKYVDKEELLEWDESLDSMYLNPITTLYEIYLEGKDGDLFEFYELIIEKLNTYNYNKNSNWFKFKDYNEFEKTMDEILKLKINHVGLKFMLNE